MRFTGKRAFFRCFECCHVVAIEGELFRFPRCFCDGELEWLGRVGPSNRLVRQEERCPCDERCTNALGPICECVCEGENHGSQRVVQVTRDLGWAPRIVVQNAEALRARRIEYETACMPLHQEIHALRSQAGWLPDEVWARYRALRKLLSRAKRLRTHEGRMRLLISRKDDEPVAQVLSDG